MIAYALGLLAAITFLALLLAIGWFIAWLLNALADIAILIAKYFTYPKGRR